MKIYLGGAGGAPTNNVIASLRMSGEERLIGTSCVATDLLLADVDERYIVPAAEETGYEQALLALIGRTRPDLVHLQNDLEVRAVSRLRDKVTGLGARLFMPNAQTIEDCVDKHASYVLWRNAGVRTPETVLISNPDDLRAALTHFGGNCWLRATEGGGGRGALPARDFDFARMWIDRFEGWGAFTAAQMLGSSTVTWLSIWHEGELVVAQTRRRKGWTHGNRTLSGVTGVTGVGETHSDPGVTDLSMQAIAAVDAKPHGIFAVDMTYGEDGLPYVTEINISRFFTTVHFFTAGGVNFPRIFADIALYDRFPKLERRINPLPDGLLWIRGMDHTPVLSSVDDFERFVKDATADA